LNAADESRKECTLPDFRAEIVDELQIRSDLISRISELDELQLARRVKGRIPESKELSS